MNQDQNPTLQRSDLDRTCHELRQPLAVVHDQAALLGDEVSGSLNQGQRELVDTILRAAGQLSELVHGLHESVDLDQLSGAPQPRIVDLNQICRELHGSYQQSFSIAGIQFSLHLQDEEPVPVPVDLERLRLSLCHLLENALQYTPSGRRVTIEVGADLDRAWICVRDAGIGIPADELERIFELNHRVPHESDENKIEGAGIGLTVSRANLESMGATLSVDSALGSGSCFQVEFDLAKVPASA